MSITTRNRFAACLLALIAILAAVIVWPYAWMSEDSFITLRYVANTLAGHGPVFNVGERVQGYTHPLWFILLVLGSAVSSDPIHVATALSLTFTTLTVSVLGAVLWSRSKDPLIAIALVVVYLLVSFASDAWVSFQTAGLENALSHLLLILFIAAASSSTARQLRWLPLIASLLAMTRPDFSLLVAPAIVLLLLGVRGRPGAIRPIALGALPLLAWMVFAFSYYGTIKANTATAKVGTLPSLQDEIIAGLHYVSDWTVHEPGAALAALGMLIVGMLAAQNSAQRAVGIGIACYLLFIVSVGGDFMRGRLLMPVYNASFFLGLTACADILRTRGNPRSMVFGLLAGASLVILVAGLPPLRQDSVETNDSGISPERLFYPGYAISSYHAKGRIENPYMDLNLAGEMQVFADKCGRYAIHDRNPGTIGYLTGPQVDFIDTLGLTDAYIASLPQDRLITAHPRIGHPDKSIPVAYLVSRADISLVDNWKTALRRGDCSLIGFTEPLRQSGLSWIPNGLGDGTIGPWPPRTPADANLRLVWRSTP
jgi:arabinofuranosyltransferase